MKHLSFLFVILLFASCGKDDELVEPMEDPKYILHISHTRSDTEGQVHDILKTIDFSKFEVLCLGGDLDLNTSASESTMDVWDNIFQFGASSTLWSLGNHDASRRSLITQYTNRPSFYAYTKDEVTFIVLDTQLSGSNIEDEQLELFNSVVDTISESGSLVVLSHKLFWMPGNADLEAQTDSIANGPLGTCTYCTLKNNFYTDVYPKLIEVKNKNIQVLCIAGDIGFKTQEFEYQTSEGIYFLASGIDTREINVKALLLEYNKEERLLEWRYEVLENL